MIFYKNILRCIKPSFNPIKAIKSEFVTNFIFIANFIENFVVNQTFTAELEGLIFIVGAIDILESNSDVVVAYPDWSMIDDFGKVADLTLAYYDKLYENSLTRRPVRKIVKVSLKSGSVEEHAKLILEKALAHNAN